MTMPRRSIAALLLACAAAIAVPAQAQVASSHEVRRGDTLFAIARKARHDGVSRNQMILAIWRANQKAFPGGNINLLEVGTVLTIPARETVAAIEPADADREVRDLLSRAVPAAQLAVARPETPAAVPAMPARSVEQAARRYQEGLVLEHKGDDQGALAAFLEAGEGGNGLAQRKLGQIYDKGNGAVRRDLQTSILWYQKARAQGVPIDKPLPRILPK
jgi:pilus assembly protein FimV